MHGITAKKKFGQHFLRDDNVVNRMVTHLGSSMSKSVLEIGCGDGFITRRILETKAKYLQVYEIDSEWADFVAQRFEDDDRLTVNTENFLDIDFSELEAKAPWSVISNVPFNVSFPILYRLQENRHLFTNGVLILQEEVAQKIVKQSGKGFGPASLFLQYYFDWELLDRVPSSAFKPEPKVSARLIAFVARKQVKDIVEPERFWKFLGFCFSRPRKTLKNNLASTHFKDMHIDPETLALRAQQMNIDQFLSLWELVR